MTDTANDLSWSPSAWLTALSSDLQLAGEGYAKYRTDEDEQVELPGRPGIRLNRTSFALMAVGILHNRISELPGLAENPGLAPLHDLIAALRDLGRGNQPALLKPIASISRGGEQIAERWIREQALLCVMLLEEADIKAGPACRIVANQLAKQGFVGRKKSQGVRGLSAGTISDWRNKSRQRGFDKKQPEVAAFLERNLKRFRQQSNWPLSPDEMTSLVIKMLQSPLVQSKSDLPPTQSDANS